MNIEDKKKELRLRDRLVRAITKDGLFRISIIKNTNTALAAQKRHRLPYVPAFFLARQFAGASMMASFLKGEERVIIEAEGAGPVQKIYAEAFQLGETRGFVEMRPGSGNLNIESLGEALGAGVLKVSRVLYNRMEPITGVVQLVKGDISTDLAYYFTQSEQSPTAVILDVNLNDNGEIIQSAGLMVQAMPGASVEKIKEVYGSLEKIDSLARYFGDENTVEETLEKIFPSEYDIIKTTPIDFFCRCSKENFTAKLLTLGEEEIISLQKDGHHELVCRYCNEKYYLEDADFVSMLEELRAKSN